MHQSQERKKAVFTKKNKCVGCYKCVYSCPVKFANILVENIDGRKVTVDPSKCIQCGNCIKVCNHNARDYFDDTELFFEELTSGEVFTVIVSSALPYNLPNYKKLFGFLKSLGVNLIVDESVGYDINAWAHLKMINANPNEKVISQSCPSAVNYIEKYKPELIQNLSKVQSPILCNAIFINKYLKNTNKVAFLSQCIAKNLEFQDSNFEGTIYNATFQKLIQYLENNNINLDEYEEYEYDNIFPVNTVKQSFSRRICNNIKSVGQDIWSIKVSEAENVCEYLNKYDNRLKNNQLVPDFVDAVICKKLNYFGTGIVQNQDPDEVNRQLYYEKLNQKKYLALMNKNDFISSFEFFDKNLDLNDYTRVYTDKSHLCKIKEPTTLEYRIIYNHLYKVTEDDQVRNCCACGYKTCKDMARAIYNGVNDYTSCVTFIEKEKEIEKKDLVDKNDEIQMINEEIMQILEDTTKLAQEKENNEQRIQAVLDGLTDGVVVINDKREIESFNSSLLSLFLYDEKELLGQSIEKILPDFNNLFKHCENDLDFKKIFDDKKFVDSKIEIEGLKKNNTYFEAEIGLNRLHLDDKILYICIIRNISERKEIDRLKSHFVSTVSHELRTPLTSIRGALGLILSGAMGDLGETITELLSIANNNCIRLVGLINDILDVEKIRAGKMDFHFEQVKLMHVINQVIKANEYYASQYNVKYALENSVIDAVINVDENRLIQVLTNLLSNAAKFSQENGTVVIAIHRDGDLIRISVKDNGPGIDDKFKDKIFTDFSQADSSDTRRKGGTGLGLSISKSIMENMGGSIGFTSKLNEGSTFYIEIKDVSVGAELPV